MGELAKKIFADAMSLPDAERAELIRELIESVDGAADPSAEQAWIDEIEVRARRAVDGSTPGVAWGTVKAELAARLKK